MSGGPLSYEPFFGLKKKPFSLASDPEFLYESPSHSAALLTLLAGIRRREGLLAFTGDVGTGKTTICRAVLRNLDRTTFSAFIPDPFASREDLLRILLIEFGVASVADITTGPLAQAGRAQLSYLLSSFLDTLVPLEAFVVVFIDEAQNMSLSLLEEVRVLSDAFNRHGQLQVVLVGQLELLENLKSPTMRQVDQRVSVYTRLEPLNADDAIGYVQHRLQIAGASPNRPMFAPMALTLLHELSGGIPRIINRICDRALQIAYERRSPLIDREIIAEAAGHAPATAGSMTAISSINAQPGPARDEEPTTPFPLETPAAFSHRVDAWLSHLDGHPRATTPPPVAEPVPPVATPLPAGDELGEFLQERVMFEAPLRRRQPERYIYRLARRWARTAAIGLVALVGLNAVVAAASYVPGRLTPGVQPGDLPPLPPPPPLRLAQAPAPAAGGDVGLTTGAAADNGARYSIAVGAYSTDARAAKQVQSLAAIGFHAFRQPLQLRDRVLYQVFVGPFDAPSSANAELQRLRASSTDYADAQILPLRPAGN
jgi:type II secretory pathway predicted ATPase ExeA